MNESRPTRGMLGRRCVAGWRNGASWIWNYIASFLVVVCNAPATAAALEAPRSATVTFDDIRAMLDSQIGCAASIHIRYHSVAEWDANELKAPPAGAHVDVEVRQMRPFYFGVEIHHGTATIPSARDPFQVAYCLDEQRFHISFPFNRTFSVRSWAKSDRLPGSLPGELCVNATGIWLLSGRPSPQQNGVSLALGDIMHSDKYALRSYLEEVMGTWCHVIEWPGRDVLWVDCRRSAALVAREIFSDDAHSPAVRYDLLEHVLLAGNPEAGLWFPRRVRSTAFRGTDDRTIIRNVQIQIDAAVVNGLTQSNFAFVVPDGGVSVDGEPRQVSAGGEEYLQTVASWIKEFYVAKSHIALQVHGLKWFGLCFLVTCSGVLAIHRKSKRSSLGNASSLSSARRS